MNAVEDEVTQVDVQHVRMSLTQVAVAMTVVLGSFATFMGFVAWLDGRLDDNAMAVNRNASAIKHHSESLLSLEKNWREGLLELGTALGTQISHVDGKIPKDGIPPIWLREQVSKQEADIKSIKAEVSQLSAKIDKVLEAE